MDERAIGFYSGGIRLDALIRMPDPGKFPHPAGGVVHAPGWMSLKDAQHYRPYHEALTSVGLAVLIFDYRGVRRTSDASGRVSLWEHLNDLHAGIETLRMHLGAASERVGVMGSGATGGAMALYAAAFDRAISAVAAISPYADGRDWLRSMRTAEEWDAFCQKLTANRRQLAKGHPDMQVDPIDGIIKRVAVRAAISFKADVASELTSSVGLSVVDSIFALNPIDVVHRIAPRALHLFAAESDIPVPYRHSRLLYESASPPKALWTLQETDGYQLHATHGERVGHRLASWFLDRLGLPGEIRTECTPEDASAPIAALEEDAR